MAPIVTAVAVDPSHRFSKPVVPVIHLIVGLGVQGDAHAGVTVQHRSRVARDPTQPNLRQVHLVQAELFDEMRAQGFDLTPGAIGENITTSGIDLLGLPTGTLLHLGDGAVVEVTGLRNPCGQLNGFAPGLMAATLGHDAEGNLVRKAGIMAIVRDGGDVRAGDPIRLELPPGSPHPLLPV